MSYIIAGVSYTLLTTLVAKYKYDIPPWGPSLHWRVIVEFITGWFSYPFSAIYWLFKLVVNTALKIDHVINKVLKIKEN